MTTAATYRPELRWRSQVVWQGDDSRSELDAYNEALSMIPALVPFVTEAGEPTLLVDREDGSSDSISLTKLVQDEWVEQGGPHAPHQLAARVIAEIEPHAATACEWHANVMVAGVSVWRSPGRSSQEDAESEALLEMLHMLRPAAKRGAGGWVPAVSRYDWLRADAGKPLSEEASFETELDAWRHAAKCLSEASIELEEIDHTEDAPSAV